MDNWTAIVMAAGKGERMRSAQPKVLHPIAGLPMARHVIRAVRHIAPAQVMVVVPSAQRGAVAEALGDDVEHVEQPDPLGTGNALATALAAAPGPLTNILLVNGDAPLLRGETVAALAALHAERAATVTILVARVPISRAGDLGRVRRGARGKLLAIVEAAGDEQDRAGMATDEIVDVNVGLYAFDAEWLRTAMASLKPHGSGEYHAVDLVAQAVADGRRVEAMTQEVADEPIGVNTRVQLAAAEAAMQTRLRERWLTAGVTMADPATTYLGDGVELNADVVIEPNTILRGTTHVATRAHIGPNAVIEDSDIGEGAQVGSSTLRGTVVGAGASVGPYCTLREGTRLEANVYVGSHVEIKNSTIGARSHVGHFAYVGDAVVGADVNIGAGAVTCNYDGEVKHVTTIEDGAFIGSDTMLVAPVRIGARASTGAGSVVTHDVPAGQTVAGVPARAHEPGRREARA